MSETAPAARATETAVSTAFRKAQSAPRKTNTAPASKPAPAARRIPEGGNVMQPFTLERAKHNCPSPDAMTRIEKLTGLETPEAADLLEKTEMHFAQLAQFYAAELGDGSEVAVQIMLQGLTQELVTRACLAGEFYDSKRNQALEAHSRMKNEERDNDRDGVAGFQSRVMGMFDFAGKMGRQAWALTAMAEGAVSAFAHVTGEEWKPRASRSNTGTVAERSLDAAASLLAA